MLPFFIIAMSLAQETVLVEEFTSQEQQIEVNIVLSNGITVRGALRFSDLIQWMPGAEGVLHFTPEAEGLLELPMNQVSSIETVAIGEPEILSLPVEIVETPEPPVESEAVNLITMAPEGGFSFSNPAASRYLYAPSSIGLQQGQGYVSQKWIFTTGVYAPTDNVTILMGVSVPIPLLTVAGVNLSRKVKDGIYMGAGAEVFILPIAAIDSSPVLPVSVIFGSVTFGDLDQHLTIATGYIHISSEMTDDPPCPAVDGCWTQKAG